MRSTWRRTTGLLAAGWLLALLPPAARADGPVVLPGYDLFASVPGTQLGVDLDGPVGSADSALVSFTGEPLGTFDFGSGPRDVGGADTIVRRLEAATPSDGRVAVELVALQLRSVEPLGYYATLQSDRGRHPLDPPDGLPSPGVLDIAFDPDGLGGTFHADLLVNYDVRQGSPAGPIVATGTAQIGGTDGWQHATSSQAFLTCHEAYGQLGVHRHCVVHAGGALTTCQGDVPPIPSIDGVTTKLNGVDQSGDFFPGHRASSADCLDDVVSGRTCQIVSDNDPTAVIDPDRTIQTGVVDAGPLVVTGPGGPASSISAECTVQVQHSDPAGPDHASVTSAPATGAAYVPPTVVSYVAPPEAMVYVCTKVAWDGHSEYVDADAETPGVQCAKATGGE